VEEAGNSYDRSLHFQLLEEEEEEEGGEFGKTSAEIWVRSHIAVISGG